MKPPVRMTVLFCALSALALVLGASSSSDPATSLTQGEDALARGDLSLAFQLLSQADDTAAMQKLASACLAAKQYDLYVSCIQEAGKKTLFRDEFQDNSHGWNTRSDDYVDAKIDHGALLINRSAKKGSSFLWTTADLDPTADFRIETKITKKSGDDTQDIALMWGMKDIDNVHMAGFTPDGSYYCGSYENGKWTNAFAWKQSNAINKGNASNTLSVQRRGEKLIFTMNATQLAEIDFEEPFGNEVGFSISPQSELEVSFLSVEQLPSARIAWGQIGDAVLAGSDLETAVKYYALAKDNAKTDAAARRCLDAGAVDLAEKALEGEGLSQKLAQVRMAKMDAEASRNRDALALLERAGWPLSKTFVFPLADEQFKDNSRTWATRDDKVVSLAVKDGAYLFERHSGNGTHDTWNTFDLSPDSDFLIEVTFTRISGADDKAFALIWGFDKNTDSDDFGITGSGMFRYGRYERDEWKAVVDRTQSTVINTGNATNTFTVMKLEEEYQFFINGARVATAPWQ
ncbi:MAG TPA: hypothetical protein VL354_18845, partial [Spirochaetia bacterium]|nr:hypothetical protein [Spirochaetia bacterium]